MEKLVNDDSKSPNICFGPVLVVNETLRAHVNGASNVEVFEFVFVLDSKAKVSDFGISVLGQKDVGHFKIPVDYGVVFKVL